MNKMISPHHSHFPRSGLTLSSLLLKPFQFCPCTLRSVSQQVQTRKGEVVVPSVLIVVLKVDSTQNRTTVHRTNIKVSHPLLI